MNENLHEKLKAAREALGLSQKELAEKIGVTQRDISIIENGIRVNIPHNLISFYVQLGLDARYFYDSIPGLSAEKYLNEWRYRINELRINVEDIIEMHRKGVGLTQLVQDYTVSIPLLALAQIRTYLHAPIREAYLARLPSFSVPTIILEGGQLVCFQLGQTTRNDPNYVIGRKIEADPGLLQVSGSYVVVQGCTLIKLVEYMGTDGKKLIFRHNKLQVELLSNAQDVEIWQIMMELRQVG
jgi:transcriptional regulator with XRE-family HTH domain